MGVHIRILTLLSRLIPNVMSWLLLLGRVASVWSLLLLLKEINILGLLVGGLGSWKIEIKMSVINGSSQFVN